MEFTDISLVRLQNQHLSIPEYTKPKEVVAWMGAMQAQDYSMVRLAVGLRLVSPDVHVVQRAIDRGEIIRTHLLRPTWHLVSSSDVRWILDLTAPHIRSLLRSRLKELELSPTILNKSMKIFEKALGGGEHLTREELLVMLEKHKVDPREQRASHILLWAELEKIICSGALKKNKNTYALFDLRVKEKKTLSREESLWKLAHRYFSSHGPATLQDFLNWSGLPAADGRKALALADKDLQSAVINTTTFWFRNGTPVIDTADCVHLLPAFDEFVIGYKDRSACLPDKQKAIVISVNGMFWPVIVWNGQVIGRWKRLMEKKEMKLSFEFFKRQKLDRKHGAQLLEKPAQKVIDFFSAVNAYK